MRKVFSLRSLMALGVAGIAAYALYASLHWPFRTALFPRIIGIPLLVLSLIEFILCVATAERAREGHAVDFEMTTDLDPRLARRRTVAIFSWILGFFMLILLFGFTLAVPLFVFLYLKLVGNERWGLSLTFTLLSWLTMEALFNRLLHIPFPEAWIFSLWYS
jgi:hypothetical protein